MMKNKYLVNVGRSNVINQKDLFEALSTKQLSGAAIDTWGQKRKNKNTKLLPSLAPFQTLNNIILSPHAAMRVEDGHEKYVKDTTLKVINYITKNELTDIVSLDKGY
jgi:phosphoglycerate dehydrogenase-like enzyme